MADYLGSNSGSLGSRKQNEKFEGSAAESGRIAAAKVAREAAAKQINRQKLTDLKRLYEHNRVQLQEKNSEVARFTRDIFHLDSEVRQIKAAFEATENQEKDSEIRAQNFEKQIQDKQADTLRKKKDLELKEREEKEMEIKMAELQRKLSEAKRFVAETEQKLKNNELEMRHLEGTKGKHTKDVSRNSSLKAVKQKEVDTKIREEDALKLRKQRDEIEIARLAAENRKLDENIKTLDRLAK